MLGYLIFAGVSVSFLIILLIYLYPGSKKKTTIPGPDPSDIQEGNLPDVIRAGSLFEYLLKLHDDYGNICGFYWGEKFVVSVADPKYFEQQIGVFNKPNELMQMYYPLISGNALQLTNNVPGRNRHKLLSSFIDDDFSKELDSQFFKVGDDLVKRWKTLSKDDHIPVSEYMTALSFKAIAIICFGNDITDKQIHALKQQYDIVWNELDSNLLSASQPCQETVDKSYEKLKNLLQTIGSQKKSQGKGLWSTLTKEVSSESAVNEIIGFITGGYRQISSWLTWCIYYTACDASIQEKMRTEVLKRRPGDAISSKDINSLKFVRQVLDETLRCACVVPWTSRVQTFDTQIDKHLIPKDTPVIQAFGVVFQDKCLFPDPENFDPTRFDEKGRKLLPSLAFTPFGFAGKRACPASAVSYRMVTVWLSQIISKFRIKLVGAEKSCPAAYGLVTRPEEEVWIGLRALPEA